MCKSIMLAVLVAFTSCSTTRYYIVRHAEKEASAGMTTTDVPLSAAGKTRAEALKSKLENKKIRFIYSTNTLRTIATATPLSKTTGVQIQVYDPRDTGLVNRLKTNGKGNMLIVGHSNTVDDLVNGFTGAALLKDLPDEAYGDLFIVRKTGGRYKMRKDHFGK